MRKFKAIIFGTFIGMICLTTNSFASIKISDGGTFLLGYVCTNLSKEEVIALDEINKFRKANGKPPLHCDSLAAEAAWNYSDDMCKNPSSFNKDHISSGNKKPKDRLDAVGAYGYSAWAENIAGGKATGETTVTGWINSPGHKANMLGPYTRMGIARSSCPGTKYGYYWTLVLLNGEELGNVGYVEGYEPFDAHISTLSMSVYTDKASYNAGDTFKLKIDLDNPKGTFSGKLSGWLLWNGYYPVPLGELGPFPVEAGLDVSGLDLYVQRVPWWLAQKNAIVVVLYDADTNQDVTWDFAYLGLSSPPTAQDFEMMNLSALQYVRSISQPKPGDSCGSGMVYDCAGKCVNQPTAQSWTGDGYCDDGTWGMDLRCPAFNNDGGDCGG